MIPRQEIEFTLAMAEKGVRAECPPEVMAKLCRVYLAWVDAPEIEQFGHKKYRLVEVG